MDAGLLLVVLALLGVLFMTGLVVLIVWLVRRTQTPATPTNADERLTPPR